MLYSTKADQDKSMFSVFDDKKTTKKMLIPKSAETIKLGLEAVILEYDKMHIFHTG